MTDRVVGNGFAQSTPRADKPTDWIITNVFMASRNYPMVFFGEEATGTLSNCHLHLVGGYTPGLFRRPRLQRFAPVAHKVNAVRNFWRWM